MKKTALLKKMDFPKMNFSKMDIQKMGFSRFQKRIFLKICNFEFSKNGLMKKTNFWPFLSKKRIFFFCWLWTSPFLIFLDPRIVKSQDSMNATLWSDGNIRSERLPTMSQSCWNETTDSTGPCDFSWGLRVCRDSYWGGLQTTRDRVYRRVVS